MATRSTANLRQPPLTSPIDVLLADIVIRLQLSPTAYREAVDHYEAIQKWVDRDESPLRGHVDACYPQGSMAIQATVASKGTADEHDLDVVAELRFPPGVSPETPLKLLDRSIRGTPGSRYWGKTRRRSRCVTVDYSNMHLDITPCVRLDSRPPRECLIFEAPTHDRYARSQSIVANPYGFAEWFNDVTHVDDEFSELFNQRMLAYESALSRLASKGTPLPAQEPAEKKSISAVILQLIKRWRNIKYESRRGRRPPSVMLAAMVAQAPVSSLSLLTGLKQCVQFIFDALRNESRTHSTIRILNPVCYDDKFTDQWPESLADQDLFIDDLRNLLDQLQMLEERPPLDEIQHIMVELFGEFPTKSVFEAFNQQSGEAICSGSSRYDSTRGAILIPGALAPAQTDRRNSRRVPKHTFFGGRE